MKQIRIPGCHEVCPYFKRVSHYDYSDELKCTNEKRDPYHSEEPEGVEHQDWVDTTYTELKTIKANCGEDGLFPSDCPLEEVR